MNSSPSTSPSTVSSKSAGYKHRWALGGLIAATTASIVLSISAWAGSEEAPGGAPAMGMMRAGPGMESMPFGGGHLQRLLDDAKVSDAQRTQIKQITDKAQTDLKALHEEGRALHEQGLKLWAAPKLDATAAEKLRQQMLAHHDKVSKRMMQAMLDVGNVLTPEQRATVASQLERRHEDMLRHMQDRRGHHRGGEKMPSDGASQRQPQEH